MAKQWDLSKEGDREDLLSQIAGTISESIMESVSDDLADKEPLDFEEIRAFFRTLWQESDRAVPIVAFAYLDSLVSRLLGEELNPAIPGGLDSLIGVSGPLGAAGAQFKVAQAIRWLDDDTAADIHALRKVRNLFAHEPSISFDDARVIGHLSGLRIVKRIIEGATKVAMGESGDPLPDELMPTPRDRFLIGMAAATGNAILRLYLAPACARVGLAPDQAMSHKELLPEPVQDWLARSSFLATDQLLRMWMPIIKAVDPG